MSAAQPAANRDNPYPGLRPFRSDEEHLFFGRENQVDAMIDKLAAHRFLAVVGTSGSGKSSLVNCGLRPALHRGLMAGAGSAWRIAQFRPGANPLHAMADALAEPGGLFAKLEQPGMPFAQIAEATLRMSDLGLVDLCQQAQMGAEVNLLVVVDQFEELFRYRQAQTHGVSNEGAALVNLLLEARAQAQCRVHVVLTMRSDFLGECSQFAGLAEAINEGQYLVPRMTRDETRRAITAPARVADAEISPVLVTRLLNDVGDNPDQLSILQHALNRSWAYWQNASGEAGALDLSHYEAIGTMSSALDMHAERAYAELSETQQPLCEKIFKALTDRGTDARGIRRPKRLAELGEITCAGEAEIAAVLAVFRKPSRSFLMPPAAETLTGETVIDISHESLMRVWKRLRDWSEEEAVSARIYRRLADAAKLHLADQASLWRDPELRMALDWHRRNEPTRAWGLQYHDDYDAAIAFLEQSRRRAARVLAEAEAERRWDKYGTPAILLLVMVPFAIAQEMWFRDFVMNVAQRRLTSFPAAFAVPLRIAGSLLLLTPFGLASWGLAAYGKAVSRRMALTRLAASPSLGDDARATSRVLQKAPAHEAPVALQTDYASTGRRIAGYAIDVVAQFIAYIVAGVVIGDVVHRSVGPDYGEEATNQLVGGIVMLTWLILNWLYNAVSTSSVKQGTPGMILSRIVITDVHGERISFLRATGWHVAKLLSYYTLFIGFAIQPFSKRRQTLHDRVAGTVVLRRPVAATAFSAAPAAAAPAASSPSAAARSRR